jgi:CBS domain-containing protein
VKGLHEKHTRSVIKSITWRIIATTTGMVFVYFTTGRIDLSATFAIFDVSIKFIEYYLHERVWNQIAFGKTLKIPIEKVIRSPPVSVQSMETAPVIIEKMISLDIGAVVVVDDQNRPIGIITERDALERVALTGREPSKILANEIMSSPVIMVESSLPLAVMHSTMKENGIRRLVVTKKGIVVGIVTERRILDALL